jgi:hypothetical protein
MELASLFRAVLKAACDNGTYPLAPYSHNADVHNGDSNEQRKYASGDLSDHDASTSYRQLQQHCIASATAGAPTPL